jgi:YfiH family protein
MALIYQPRIFKPFPHVRAAMTLRGTTHLPYGFNLSLSVGDDEGRVMRNRAQLASRLGFSPERLATQRQVHGDTIAIVGEGYIPGESDALIAPEPAWLLAISTADCIPVLIYDRKNDIVAGAHSGWRGSAVNITGKLVARLRDECTSEPAWLHVYVGTSAGQCCYEVGEEVASRFDERHSRPIDGGKYLFDNRGVVLDQLLEAGVPPQQIELDSRCTICDPGYHSYRRDGRSSGRMFGVIGILPV